jgi:hypothetical protein
MDAAGRRTSGPHPGDADRFASGTLDSTTVKPAIATALRRVGVPAP